MSLWEHFYSDYHTGKARYCSHTWEAEEGRVLRVWGQLRLHSEFQAKWVTGETLPQTNKET